MACLLLSGVLGLLDGVILLALGLLNFFRTHEISLVNAITIFTIAVVNGLVVIVSKAKIRYFPDIHEVFLLLGIGELLVFNASKLQEQPRHAPELIEYPGVPANPVEVKNNRSPLSMISLALSLLANLTHFALAFIVRDKLESDQPWLEMIDNCILVEKVMVAIMLMAIMAIALGIG